jgi:uncharacterized lipoprotein NlpE involved in copper resistance
MNRASRAIPVLVSILAGGCLVVPPKQMGGPSAPAPADTAVVKMMGSALLPALYRGDLPCADCAGTRYSLDLRRDHVFFLRMTHLGKGAGGCESFDDTGQWSLSTDARTLTLTGGRQPVRFWIENSETLRLLDQAGQRIDSPLNYELKRVASYVALTPKTSADENCDT